MREQTAERVRGIKKTKVGGDQEYGHDRREEQQRLKLQTDRQRVTERCVSEREKEKLAFL